MADALTLKGIVFPCYDFKEKDKLIPYLTRDMGLIKLCAKGASGRSSKFAALTVPFSICDITFTESNGFYYVKDYVINESNSSIQKSLDLITAASHIFECVKVCASDSVGSDKLYELCVYALYSLNIGKDYKTVCSLFNWKLLDILGLSIIYTNCSNCMNPIIEDKNYHLGISSGKLLCSSCTMKQNLKDTVVVNGKVLSFLNEVKQGELKKIFAYKVSEDMQKFLVEYTECCISAALEADLFSLKHYEETLFKFSIPSDPGKA